MKFENIYKVENFTRDSSIKVQTNGNCVTEK